MEEHKIIKPTISEYLAGLSVDQLDEVLTLYNQKEVKIVDIIHRYSLEKINIGAFKNHLPPSICKDYVCPVCLVYSWTKPITRGIQSIPFCPQCHTAMYSEYKGQSVQNKKIQGLKKGTGLTYHINRELFWELDFESKVFIGAISAGCMSEEINSVQCWRIKMMKFYPLPELQNDMLNSLNVFNNKIENVIIEIEEDLIKELQNPTDAFGSTVQERYELWKKIALAEAREIFTNEMNSCGFFSHPNETDELVLYSLLEDYSVGQIYNIIWRSVRKGTTDYAKTDNRSFASSAVINHCQKFAAIKKANGEKIENYNRPYHSRQSRISQYYFDSVLKIGKTGFEMHSSSDYFLCLLI
ncbi:MULTISPECIES: hypothetical protein [unclassified Carboxylicivirga]|uniref:hypothetical protein n=1 Tax=Carboxylicivirga TaxID=1628153 RepID=UPI003D3499CA